jgi:polyribonucleotide nucleotidyltransferase
LKNSDKERVTGDRLKPCSYSKLITYHLVAALESHQITRRAERDARGADCFKRSSDYLSEGDKTNMPVKKYLKESIKLGDKELTVETGRVAKQADGSVVIRYGDTMLLVAAVGAPHTREGIDFFPLTVEYREANYAAGRIPGNYFRREGRPTEKETLTSRLIDRPCRPLFTEGYKNETQVIASVISADPDNNPDVIAITGASCALYLSDIPFPNPIAGVRVGLIDGRYIINPTYDETRESRLNLIVAGTEEAIVMVEAGASEVSEEIMVEALMLAHKEINRLCRWQRELYKALDIQKRAVEAPALNEEMLGEIERNYSDRLRASLDTTQQEKRASYAAVDALKKEVVDSYPEDQPEKRQMAKKIFDHLKETIFRDDILNKRRRPDGRRFSEIRPITCEVGWLPRVHGSALFTRGETQALVTTTLGTKDDEQFMDDLEKGEVKRRFLLHYNFPHYSVGEVGRFGSSSRREIGHGALARRSIEGVLPDESQFPYTIRIVSDITESNGSSSMASICGGILSLMDAGVPLKAPVAGVAMGLVMEGNKYAILSDIAGAEDHYGDMDFKVAGTREGITALQMDIKISGINASILAEALEQAKKGRLHILDAMEKTIAEPREDIAPYAPRIIQIKINPDKIREVIGPGGKIIRALVEETGAKIDVEDDGTISIASADGAAAQAAIDRIRGITAEAEIGQTYLGTVSRIVDFGAFVEIFPGTDGLLHISEIADRRVKDVRDELKEGQQIMVKCIGKEGNKIKLSRKAILRDEQQKAEAAGAGDGE